MLLLLPLLVTVVIIMYEFCLLKPLFCVCVCVFVIMKAIGFPLIRANIRIPISFITSIAIFTIHNAYKAQCVEHTTVHNMENFNDQKFTYNL